VLLLAALASSASARHGGRGRRVHLGDDAVGARLLGALDALLHGLDLGADGALVLIHSVCDGIVGLLAQQRHLVLLGL